MYMSGHTHAVMHMWRSEVNLLWGATTVNQFSPSTTWVPGIKLRSSGLAQASLSAELHPVLKHYSLIEKRVFCRSN